VLVTRAWPQAEQRLAAGGAVLYLPRKADLDWTSPPLADVPVFWNRLMNPGWSRMLGLWIDRSHGALAGFPTSDHFDWQWAELAAGGRAMNLDRLPRGLRPIVQPIDDWNRNYKLGALFEARVGQGRLMVSTLDLDSRLDERPAARQLRKSVLDYMRGPGFRPKAARGAGRDAGGAVRHPHHEKARARGERLAGRRQHDRRRPEHLFAGWRRPRGRGGAPSAAPAEHRLPGSRFPSTAWC
jgi:hypothetical protein